MKAGGFPYVIPMLLLSVAFFATPLAVLVGFSFAGPDGATLANYVRFFGDAFNFRVLINTARLGLETVLATTLLGVPIALLYWHSGKTARQVIIFLTLIPMLTSNVVRTFAWIVILGRQGPISEALMGLGLTGSPISLMFTELGLVMAMCQIDLPLIILAARRHPVAHAGSIHRSGAGLRCRPLAHLRDRAHPADAAGLCWPAGSWSLPAPAAPSSHRPSSAGRATSMFRSSSTARSARFSTGRWHRRSPSCCCCPPVACSSQ
jgi:ABC-type spermidine/putrescine transport system permease subunit I